MLETLKNGFWLPVPHISNKYNKEIKNVRLFGSWILSSCILYSFILEGLPNS